MKFTATTTTTYRSGTRSLCRRMRACCWQRLRASPLRVCRQVAFSGFLVQTGGIWFVRRIGYSNSGW